MMKREIDTTCSPTSIELVNAVAVGEKDVIHCDEIDMDRMGKVQVLRVCYHRALQRFTCELTSQ